MPRLTFAALALCCLLECDATNFTVNFGPKNDPVLANNNLKCLTYCCDDVVECSSDAGDPGHRLNADGALGRHTFSISTRQFETHSGGVTRQTDVCARRTDQNLGWAMDLQITCRRLEPADQGCAAVDSGAERCCQHYDAATGVQPCVEDRDGSCGVARPKQTFRGSCPARQVPADQTCYWLAHHNVFSRGFAQGNGDEFVFEEAKLRCIQLGPDCSAVTCFANSGLCTMRASTILEPSPSGETTHTKVCLSCSWRSHDGRFSRGFADDVSEPFSLIEGQSKCVEMGAACRAVTCATRESCTVRGSSLLEGSPSGETTFVKDCGFAPGYVVAPTRLSAKDAFDHCSGIGSSLVVPRTTTEMDNVRSLLRHGEPIGAWLGIVLNASSGEWERADGEPLSPTFWDGGEAPINASGPYAAMVFSPSSRAFLNVTWRDFPADAGRLHYAVCTPLAVL